MDKNELIDMLVEHVRWMKAEGVKDVEFDGAMPALAPAQSPAIVTTAPAKAEQTAETKPAPAPVRAATPARAPSTDAAAGLADIAQRVAACEKCRLYSTRTKTVPGQGHSAPDILFIGEGPGEDEDRQGLAFVGRAGQLLTKIIEAMGFKRDDVFIGNIVKCRPPDNRVPAPDEMAMCLPYLKEQITLLKPKVIVALGATAVKGLMNTQEGITRLRGKWLTYEGIDMMPTYHPAYLLRNPAGKRDVWDDMKAVLKQLGRTPPSKA